MLCTQCGRENADSAIFCNSCGQRFAADTSTHLPATAITPETKKTDGKAVFSLILGILSLTILSVLAGIPAIILGHVSRANIKKSMGRLAGEGMALAGLIMGYISFAIVPFILIVAAIAIPNLLRARTAANEASAVGGVRIINTALITYASQHSDTGFPQRIEDLMSGTPDAQLDPSFTTVRYGYQFTYTLVPSEGSVADKYFVVARPVTPGTTGTRSFCSDETGIIRYSRSMEPCTASSLPLQ